MNDRRAGVPLRSWLFVPGRQRAQAGEGARQQPPTRSSSIWRTRSIRRSCRTRGRAWRRVLAAAAAGTGPQLWVRVNAPGERCAARRTSRASARSALPAGIVLPKVSCAGEILDDGAGACGSRGCPRRAPRGRMRLLVLVTETPQGLLALPQYPQQLLAARRRSRAAGRTHLGGGGPERRARRHAANAMRAAHSPSPSSSRARACLLAAAALGVQAIDGVHTDFRDARRRCSGSSRRRAAMASAASSRSTRIRSAPINAAFTPDRGRARSTRGASWRRSRPPPVRGVASLDGQMIDRPHLLQAQRILAQAPKTRGADHETQDQGRVAATAPDAGRGARAREQGHVEEHVPFAANAELIYRLTTRCRRRPDQGHLQRQRGGDPRAASAWRSEWCATDQVTLAHSSRFRRGPCRSRWRRTSPVLRRAPSEDESDNFPHPQAGGGQELLAARAGAGKAASLGRGDGEQVLGRVDVDGGTRHRHAHHAVGVTPQQRPRARVAAQLRELPEEAARKDGRHARRAGSRARRRCSAAAGARCRRGACRSSALTAGLVGQQQQHAGAGRAAGGRRRRVSSSPAPRATPG